MVTTETRLTGLGVSEGARLGKAFVYRPIRVEDADERKADDSAGEKAKLLEAKSRCRSDLERLAAHAAETLGEDKAVILKGQISMLADPSFYPPMERLIETESWSAETALRRIVLQTAGLFESMANEYMRERASDVRDLGSRLLLHLRGEHSAGLADIREEVVIVADDLTPSDTVQLDRERVLGIVTRIGGKTSHTAILAQSLGIAAVLGVGSGIEAIRSGDTLAVDGTSGLVVVRPDEATVREFEAASARERDARERLAGFAGREAVTRDGFRAEIGANIGTPQEAEGLLALGAEGVGLYRTEFLFMSRGSMPDEETQFQAYRSAVEAMQGRPVVIRTLDVGGDKELPYLDTEKEANPFLGYRAIRLCLGQRELLETQLRAILRASAFGEVKIMFPMISGLNEWRQARAIFEETREALKAEGIAQAEKVEVGIMVEIPSAALQADRFAREVDFFSIGTNDLVQYALAVDRMNERVADLYDYFHPAVLRLIKQVIDASDRHGRWTGMCGSMAGDPLAAPLLVGLGLNEWSMAAPSVPKLKEAISGLDRRECADLAEKLLDLDTPQEVRRELERFMAAAGR